MTQEEKNKKPNIIFLLNDHDAYYGHGEMAGGPKIQRPNFDKLADKGIKFTHAYSVCPLCGPARRSMLTGLYPHNHNEIKNNTNYPFDKDTYLDLLSDAGYKNYYYGKWHAGPGTALDHNCEGFSYTGYNQPYNKPEYKEYIEKNNLPEFEARIVTHLMKKWANLFCGYKVGELYKPKGLLGPAAHATGIMEIPKENHEAFFLASLACDKLKEIAKNGNEKPFHLRVDFWGPHMPYFVTQEYLDKYNPEDIPEYPNFKDDLKNKPKIYRIPNLVADKNKVYPNPLPWPEWQKILAFHYAQITLVDEAAGLILNTLEELGLAENTIVVWTGDHGDVVASHGGLFDKDAFMSEELMRIPMVISYPNSIPAGQISEKFVSNMDLAQTFLDIAGTSFNNQDDGESLLPLCIDPNTSWREDLMLETHGHFHTHLARMIVWDKYKYIWNDGDMDELYDLKGDPYEMDNLIMNETYKDLIEDMKIRLKKWRDKSGDDVEDYMLQKGFFGIIKPLNRDAKKPKTKKMKKKK
ncbi:MAG: sulfatase-like hydrolase/transferase [archaeon]|nr:sulfatase-like hydrolase/transferase [archaeon]